MDEKNQIFLTTKDLIIISRVLDSFIGSIELTKADSLTDLDKKTLGEMKATRDRLQRFVDAELKELSDARTKSELRGTDTPEKSV